MKPSKEEHEKIQAQILQHLFDTAKPATIAELRGITKTSASETQYHCERLGEKGLLEYKPIMANRRVTEAYQITPKGRKFIMEKEN
ncbi:MAG: winged helix DNA-binding protein [Verrucomicrobiota bacterium]|jgi:DNA-binding MarR family transcriptional regulator